MSRGSAIRAGLVAVIALACALAASTWRTYGHTWDEPEHLAAGLELLDSGQYEYDTEHPPLARALLALGPFLAGSHSFGTPPPDGTQEGIDILYEGGHYTRTLTLARLGALPFLIVLLLSMWLWGRRVLMSDAQALLAVVLLAATPPVLGHAALATLDVPGAATTLLALYLLQRWIERGAWRDAVLAGLAAGVAIGTKLSAIPFLAIGALVLLLARSVLARVTGGTEFADDKVYTASPQVAPLRLLAGAGLAALATLVPILLAYGRRSFDLTELPPRFNWVLPFLFHDGHESLRAAIAHLRLPEAFWDFAEGVVALKAHNDTGHVSFLLGHVKAGGWWYFYLVDLAVKTPVPLLATGLPGVYLLARDGWRQRNPWRVAPLLLFAALLAFASLYSHINIGIRHVLILYPLLALGSAHALTRMGTAAAGRAVAVLLVAWQVSTWWTANPDYLPYFNEAVRHPERVVVDSDLDWGQDLRRLVLRLKELAVPSISLAYQGTADLARESLPPFELLGPRRTATGWVAVTALSRAHEPLGYAWLDQYTPVERIGKTIDLYFIPPQPAAAAPH